MTTTERHQEENLRQAFKYFNRFMLLLWRLGLGPWLNAWPAVIGQIMVLTHIGRKSGLKRHTPVNYALVDGEIYFTAGFGSSSDWYRNIQANPVVEVWLPDGWWSGVAEEVTDPVARLPLLRQVLIGSGFAASAFGGIDPRTITDEVLKATTSEYCLLHVHRTAACTGSGGPGDLAWVWPLGVIFLLPLVLRPRRRYPRER